MNPKFEIRRSRNPLRPKRRYVVLIGENGEPLSSTELFEDKQTARENIAAQREAAAKAWIDEED